MEIINVDGEHLTSEVNFPYIDREVSWLAFNQRVLNLATDSRQPFLERLKFLAIANSNLDEFFSIRIAGRLRGSTEAHEITRNTTVSKILKGARQLLKDSDNVYADIINELANLHNIRVHTNMENLEDSISEHLEEGQDDSDIIDGMSEDQIATDLSSVDLAEFFSAKPSKLDRYFYKHIYPSLTPMVLDKTRPLPHLKPFSIYIALTVKFEDGDRIGLVEIPPHLERIVTFQKKRQENWYFVEDIVISYLDKLYPGIEYSDVTGFRILRDGDFTPDDRVESEASYVESMMLHVRSRILENEPVRVDIWRQPSKKILNMLKDSLDIGKKFIFHTERLKMADLMSLYVKLERPHLKYAKVEPLRPFRKLTDRGRRSMLQLISKQDYIVHHPYESFADSVYRFVHEACSDPDVISIKQTLYRSGVDSKILESLLLAAQNGKNVVVVMEIKARFDEEANIGWAEKLKKAGATVVYGYEHIKTHAKMIHVFRIKDGVPQQFVHIGTGNYNEKNAKIYTDFSYFTSNRQVCQDVSTIFNSLTGGIISNEMELNHIKISPIITRNFLYEMIDNEIAKGEDGYIFIKVNNIADPDMTKKLYNASQAGVSIDIVCRTSCSVQAKVPGVSDNIRVRSIVGRYLEHSRLVIFGRGENARYFITSSDLMTRNLDRRLEILFEVTGTTTEFLGQYQQMIMQDTVNMYEMNQDGNMVQIHATWGAVNSQIEAYQLNHNKYE